MRHPRAFDDAAPLLDPSLPALLGLEPAQGPGWEIEPCDLSHQEKTEWCWAAVTQAVERGHGIHDSQCEIARSLLATCGADCTGLGCNSAQSLPDILDRRQRLRKPTLGTIVFSQIQQEIHDGHAVVCCRLDRGEGIGHFVIICGYSESTGVPRVAILDPAMEDPQPQAHDFGAFLVAYEEGGRWDQTYLTQ